MKTSNINIHICVDNSMRVDPSYFLSEGIKVRYALSKSPYGTVSLGNCTKDAFFGNIFSRIFVRSSEYGIPYLAASDTMLEDIDTGEFIAFRQARELKHLWLKKGWVLVTCSGTVGNVTFTNSLFENRIATHDLIRIIPDESTILPGVLFAFLYSKYGFYQLSQSSYGGVVKHINDAHVKSIVIPLFPESIQTKVNTLISESALFREKAREVLSSAKDLIQKSLYLDYNSKKEYTSRYFNFSTIRDSFKTRIDPSFFINNGKDCIDKASVCTKRLGDCRIKTWYPGIFKRCYVADGLPYIKGSALFDRDPFKSCDYLSRTLTPNLDELWLKDGMLLISCAGLCGKVKLITKEYEDKYAIGSPDIIRLISTDELVTTEYIFAYLQLPAVYDYIQSLKYGSVIERIDAQNIQNMPIYIPSIELSRNVTDLIKQYKEYTYQAYCNDENAVKLIEQEIESWSK